VSAGTARDVSSSAVLTLAGAAHDVVEVTVSRDSGTFAPQRFSGKAIAGGVLSVKTYDGVNTWRSGTYHVGVRTLVAGQETGRSAALVTFATPLEVDVTSTASGVAHIQWKHAPADAATCFVTLDTETAIQSPAAAGSCDVAAASGLVTAELLFVDAAGNALARGVATGNVL